MDPALGCPVYVNGGRRLAQRACGWAGGNEEEEEGGSDGAGGVAEEEEEGGGGELEGMSHWCVDRYGGRIKALPYL